MPTIMTLLVFQSSRRLLLQSLLRSCGDAEEHRKNHKDQNTPEGEAESRRIDNLLRALKVAEEEVNKLEYWSDLRKMEKKRDDLELNEGGIILEGDDEDEAMHRKKDEQD
jgi:hypothetical protein